MSHEMENHGPHKHDHAMKGAWYSWNSPVGLGIFMLTGAIGAAVALYAIVNILVSVAGMMHPAPAQQGFSAQDIQALQQQMTQGQGVGAGQ